MPSPRQPHKIKIDPLFVIPEGAEELFVYSRDGVDGSDGLTDDNVSVEILGEGIDSSEYDDTSLTEDTLGAPDSFQILSQTVRRSSGGIMVVDVVLQIDDVPSATNYEVQVIKQ